MFGGQKLRLSAATLLKMDVYVATDSYKPGSAIWLKYSVRNIPKLRCTRYSCYNSCIVWEKWLKCRNYSSIKLLELKHYVEATVSTVLIIIVKYNVFVLKCF